MGELIYVVCFERIFVLFFSKESFNIKKSVYSQEYGNNYYLCKCSCHIIQSTWNNCTEAFLAKFGEIYPLK